MNQLEKSRQTIDSIDQQIAKLYEQRMDAVKTVLKYKKDNQLPILDSNREKDVIAKSVHNIQNPDYIPFYKDFVKNLMRNSKEYQQSLLSQDIIAYAGVKGAFAHLVSDRLFPGNPKKGFKSFDEVFKAVVDRKVQYGVIPLENTNSGLVGEVLDGLLKYPVYVRKMADQKIEQCLLGVPGASLKDIQYVYSKDQALMQADEFLKQLKVQTVAYPNTAMAARYVADEQDIHKAAIGAKENADLYDLEILATKIEANPENKTRFLVIGREPQMSGDHFSLLFTLPHKSGSLSNIIRIIAEHGLNMDSIQSRPLKGKPFEYFFFIEIDENLNEENTKACLKEVEEACEYYKVLGTYPIEGYKEEAQI